MSLALSVGRTSVPAGEFTAGCCAFNTGMAAKMGEIKATHVRSFMVMAEPPDTTDLVRWVLRSLAWLVGILILLASPKDTKNAPEKTFFVLSLRLRLTLCRLST